MKSIPNFPTELILDNLPALVFIKDTNNTILKVNSLFATMLGTTKKKLENTSCWDIFPKKAADKYWEDDKKIVQTGIPKTQIIEQMELPNKTYNWYRTDKYPFKDTQGNIIGVIGISIDINSAKIEHDKLIQLQAAIEHSPSIVVITDPSGRIKYINPKFTTVTGYSKKDALGKNIKILKSGKMDKAIYTQLWDTITKGEIWKGEFLNKTKDSIYYWEVANIAPVKNDDGDTISYIKVSYALTDLQRTVFNVWNAFEESHNYVMVINSKMKIVYCNTALALRLGLESSNAAVGEDWKRFIPETDLTMVKTIHYQIVNHISDVEEFTNDIQDIYGNRITTKWFHSAINGNTDLVFSVGVPTKLNLTIHDTVDQIRKKFKESLDNNKQFILAMKAHVQNEKK